MTTTWDWMQTYSGKKFLPMAPRIEDICIEDIAHALSMLCRYGGHCNTFYSVAEHSWHCSYAVAPEYAFAALMHDASEAYLVDMPRPIKNQLPGYREAEARLEQVISTKYGLEWPMPAEVKRVDNAILFDERKVLLSEPPEKWANEQEPLGIELELWGPECAKYTFLERFYQLTEEQK
jgi:hypothetical protein